MVSPLEFKHPRLIALIHRRANTGKSRDFWSKSDSHLFGTPLISSTCRSNSLSRQTGNFLERIRYQKRDNCEPEPTEQRKLERRRMAAGRGLVPVSFRMYSDPFESPRSLIVGPVSTAPIPLHPAHPASSRQIKPSVVCRSAVQTP